MRRGPAVTVVGFSGPDGAGKSSLQRAVADAAVTRGAAVRTTYLYGCLACRNLRLPHRLARAVSSPGPLGHGSPASAGRTVPFRRQRLHAVIDTAELTLRLRLVCHGAVRTSRRSGQHVLVLTDRSPLDALVKHDLPAAGRTARWLRGLAGRCAAIVLLDAPGAVLASRDGEHAVAGLERARQSYRRWSALVPGVRTVSTEAADSGELARMVLDDVLGYCPAADSSA